MAMPAAALPGVANASLSAVGVAGLSSPATLQGRIPAALLRSHYHLHYKPLPDGFPSHGRIPPHPRSISFSGSLGVEIQQFWWASLCIPRLSCFAANNSSSMTMPALEEGSNGENDGIPTPKVVIDQDSDPDATVVEITFGDRLGALLDTMEALRDLNLNVVKASVCFDDSGKHNKFCITRADTGRKVDSPELLEAIRLTIINNLITYHPESSNQLAMGEAFGIMPPTKKVDVDIATHINIYDDGPNRSLLCIETADRPGLLVEIVKTIMDVSIDVQSAEFDTEGLLAKAKFHVSYRGGALTKPLQEVLSNCLRYFIRRPSTEESSF